MARSDGPCGLGSGGGAGVGEAGCRTRSNRIARSIKTGLAATVRGAATFTVPAAGAERSIPSFAVSIPFR